MSAEHNADDPMNEVKVDGDGDDTGGVPSSDQDTEYTVNFNIFENIESGDHCRGRYKTECKALDRIVTILDYHQFVVVNALNKNYSGDAKRAFISFCDELYPKKSMLNDYIHFVECHADPDSIESIKKRLHFMCESAKACGATARHYRDRRGDDANEVVTNWYIGRIDTVHFMVHHLTELGLRVPTNVVNSDMVNTEDEDDSQLVDIAMKRVAEVIKKKRGVLSSERLDGAANSKFTLAVDEQNDAAGANGQTKSDFVFDETWNANVASSLQTENQTEFPNEKVLEELHDFSVKHEFDSDCMEEDLKLFEEEKESNISHVLDGNDEILSTFHTIWRQQNILNRSFATGHPLWYWEFYKRDDAEERAKLNPVFGYIDLGGHSFKDLSVEQHYANLKAEVLATGLLTPQQFQEFVVDKAEGYLKSDKCREMRSNSKFGWSGKDTLYFNIPNGSSLKPEHLQVLILYCDYTALCTLFSKTLRKNKFADGLKEIKKQNSKFFHFSKFLREVVTYFGSNARGDMNGRVMGPFFSGVSVVLNVSAFSIGFNAPTSTTKTLSVAMRFAGDEGMIITVSNKDYFPSFQPLFNCTWISNFVEEDEYFWFGSISKLQLVNLFMVTTNRSYRESIAALSFFDSILSSTFSSRKRLSIEHQSILEFCIKHALKEPLPEKPDSVDDFVLDNVYCYTQKKTQVTLHLDDLRYLKKSLVDLLFYPLSDSRGIPVENSNIFRPELFKLFANLKVLTLGTTWYGTYPVNLSSLVSVLEHCEFLDALELEINDGHSVWLTKEYVESIKHLFAAKHFHFDYEKKRSDSGRVFPKLIIKRNRK